MRVKDLFNWARDSGNKDIQDLLDFALSVSYDLLMSPSFGRR